MLIIAWNTKAGNVEESPLKPSAPATSHNPASYISEASQSRPRFPALYILAHQNATIYPCSNAVCQPPTNRKDAAACRDKSILPLFPRDFASQSHPRTNGRPELYTPISKHLLRIRHALINANGYSYRFPRTRLRDGKRPRFIANGTSLQQQHAFPLAIRPFGFMHCHQRARLARHLLSR